MILERQRIALRVMQLCGGSASRLHITKWLFLFERKSHTRAVQTFYRFMPYRYGPFSFALHHEFDNLIRLGYVVSQDRLWELTDLGSKCQVKVASDVERDLRIILDRYGRLGVDDLLDVVYREFPWYSMLSEMENRRAVTRPEAGPQVYTIGYEGVQVDEFASSLLRHGIRRVIDVRSNPISRRYGFHKTTLSRILDHLGIDYQHFPELGISSEFREHARQESDMVHLFKEYESELLSHSFDVVRQVGLNMTDVASALMCMESDPDRCHRSILAPIVSTQIDLPVSHLLVAE